MPPKWNWCGKVCDQANKCHTQKSIYILVISSYMDMEGGKYVGSSGELPKGGEWPGGGGVACDDDIFVQNNIGVTLYTHTTNW